MDFANSEFTRRVFIVIPAANLSAANGMAANLDYDEADDTFRAESALSKTGKSPATHYCVRTALKPDQLAQLAAAKAGYFPNAIMEEYDLALEPTKPDEILERLGLKPVLVSE